jgi:hydrogenase-4 component B
MENLLFIAPVILSFLIFYVPARTRNYYALLITLFVAGVTSRLSLISLMHLSSGPVNVEIGGSMYALSLVIDPLSAFFILVVNFTAVTGIIYSIGYLRSYRRLKTPVQLSLHFFSYVWLYFSMLGVLMLHDGVAFLIAWELMAVSSFMLILFEAEKRATLKTAVNYLIQMHVGLVLLLIAFLLTEKATGEMSFDALKQYFSVHPNAGLFFLFFAGFAFKAGFLPFHTWLPEAHPAAPSNVSALMSGVMIKMGIYGIFRVLGYVQADLFTIGWIILLISVISGLMGVMLSVVQSDMKKMLAYCSIENIGIVGIGIGVGVMGLGTSNALMAILGLGGALLHVLNHSLAKSLLFFSAGSVYQSCHTKNIEDLGGVIRKMPQTSALFLAGSLAISGLPPLNGFISEILIFSGIFAGLTAGGLYQSLVMVLAVVSLALIGGIAIFAFTRVFGVAFLGSPRTNAPDHASDPSRGMLFPQYLAFAGIVILGLFPFIIPGPLGRLVTAQFPVINTSLPDNTFMALAKISVISLVLIGIVAALGAMRYFRQKYAEVRTGPTWGCGYTLGTPKQQYTGASWAENFTALAGPLLEAGHDYRAIHEDDIFPAERSFISRGADLIYTGVKRLLDGMMWVLKMLARLQTGNIRHYILYAFIFILIIFVLLYLHIL